MGIKARTKWMFAEELQNMLKTMSLSKVHIKDLCSRCGVKRQVFYYHFKDKYDLVAWIFTQDFVESLKTAGGQPGVFQLAKALTLIQEKKTFYKQAFDDNSQNALWRYIQNYDVNFNTEILLRYLRVDKLDKELSFAIRYHSYGCLCLTIEWIKNDCKLTPEEFAELQLSHMPLKLKEAMETQIIDVY